MQKETENGTKINKARQRQQRHSHDLGNRFPSTYLNYHKLLKGQTTEKQCTEKNSTYLIIKAIITFRICSIENIKNYKLIEMLTKVLILFLVVIISVYHKMYGNGKHKKI